MAVGVKIFAVLLSFCVGCPFVFAADVGTVTYVEGRVDSLRPDSEMGMPLRQGDTIAVGDAVRTKSNSKLEVTFSDKSVLRVAQNSKVVVKDYQLDENDRRKTASLSVERGKVRTIIAKMPRAADFIISTPNASGTVKGSDIFTSYQAGNSGMLVADGKLSVVNTLKPEPAVMIPAGNAVVVSLEDSPKGPRQYFETEKRSYEQDTDIPSTVSRTPGASIIKGAIAKLSGDVRVTFKATGESRAASINDILEAGDYIETGDNGMVEIKFDNGNGMNLKPDSNVRITSLVMDPKTGEYENLFESSKGKIRSRIEGLKGKSKFEVRTPTAVSGARGTIMYLEITPTGVKAFFEGGTGSLMNLISGVEKMVGAGEHSSADISGAVSNSMPTPEGDRMSWGEGWTPGDGTEGYSSPDGSTGAYLSDEGGKIGIVGRGALSDIDGGMGNEPFSDPLLDVYAGDDTEEGGTVEEVTSGSSGRIESDIYPYDNYDGTPSGSFSGIIAIIGTFWDGNDAAFLSIGNINTGTQSPFIWNGTLHSYFKGSGETYYNTSTDGGAFYGVVSGIGGVLVEDVSVLIGFASLLYIDPSGNAGVAQGDIVGPYSEDDDTYFLVSSKLTGSEKVEGVGIVPSELIYNVSSGVLTGNISCDDEYISGSATSGDTYYINGQKWGVYNISFGSSYNYYNNDGSKTWFTDIGGSGYFGSRDTDSYGVMNGKFYGVYDGGYGWLGTSAGSWEAREEGEEVAGEYAAQYIGFAGGVSINGIMEGAMIAIYDQSIYTGYTFNETLFGFSGFEAAPIAEGGFSNGNAIYVDDFNGKFCNISDKDWGIWGARFRGSADGDGSIFKIFLGGDVMSDMGEGYNTEGYWCGFATGLKSSELETITGVFSGLSIGFMEDESTKVSLVSGSILGGMDSEYSWEMVGLGSWRWVGSADIYPGSVEDFIDSYINEGAVNMLGSGYFNDSGTMSVDSFEGYIYNVTGQRDGIWLATFGGECEGPTTGFDVGLCGVAGAETYRYILGEVKGPSDDVYLSGAYNGIWIGLSEDQAGVLVGGTMTGEAVGYIDVDEAGIGTWEAVAAGEWVEADALLTTNMETLTTSIQELSNSVNVRLTEVASLNIVTESSGIALSATTMNVNLYAVQPNMLQGIWASIISGHYSNVTNPGGWTATISNGNDITNLVGTNWNDGQWAATVEGTVAGNTITGQASGTYTGEGSGEFTGVGAGTWNAPDAPTVTPPSIEPV